MSKFDELKAGHQAQINAEIQRQRKAGTLYEGEKKGKLTGKVNCVAVAPFKTTDKNGIKIGKGSMATFWYNKNTNIARLYYCSPEKAATWAAKAPVKAVEAPKTSERWLASVGIDSQLRIRSIGARKDMT